MIWNSGAPNDGGCCGCRVGACDPCFPRCGHAEDVLGEGLPYVDGWEDLNFTTCAGCSASGGTPWDGFMGSYSNIYCWWDPPDPNVRTAWGRQFVPITRRITLVSGQPADRWMLYFSCGSGRALWGGFFITENLTPFGTYTYATNANAFPELVPCNSDPETIEIILAVPPP